MIAEIGSGSHRDTLGYFGAAPHFPMDWQIPYPNSEHTLFLNPLFLQSQTFE